MDHDVRLGQLIGDGEKRRDAIHIAVAPVTAGSRLLPGQHVGLVREDDFERVGSCPPDRCIGIVDPFLTTSVEAGQRFWICLYPGTITSLRHAWAHPAFAAAAATRRQHDG